MEIRTSGRPRVLAAGRVEAALAQIHWHNEFLRHGQRKFVTEAVSKSRESMPATAWRLWAYLARITASKSLVRDLRVHQIPWRAPTKSICGSFVARDNV